MPSFTYTGDATRIFPDLTLEVEPGDVVERETNPDLRWFKEKVLGEFYDGSVVASRFPEPVVDSPVTPVEE
jgi:hypothetical protein